MLMPPQLHRASASQAELLPKRPKQHPLINSNLNHFPCERPD